MLFLAALGAALTALPAIAQQGPAGVPGAFGLAETVTATLPLEPATIRSRAPASRAAIADCKRAQNVERCQKAKVVRKKARAACSGRSGSQLKTCLSQRRQTINCQKASDPALCLQHQKTRQLCAATTGDAHRQCLRDNLTTRR